jgi:hypothetical protein
MKNTNIFYALEISDIQDVAQESIQRELSEPELKKVISEVEKRMPWYDIINDSIEEVVAG